MNPLIRIQSFVSTGLMVILIMCSMFSHAGTERSSVRLQGNEVSDGGAGTGTIFELEDNKFQLMQNYSLWSDLFTNDSYRSKVILGIDPAYTGVIDEEVELEVFFKVTSWGLDGNGNIINNSAGPEQTSLKVHWNTSGESGTDKAVFLPTHGLKLKVEITNILCHTGGCTITEDLPEHMYMELQTEIDRYYTLDLTDAAHTINHQENLTTDELELSWGYVEGAEEYDLEWTFVNNYGTDLNQFNSTADYEFRHNSTRVRVSTNSYRIPLVFENGFLLYRVRPIAYGGDDFDRPVPGSWSLNSSGQVADVGSSVFNVDHHLDDEFNWTYQATFAEEGKRKDVISYFDGSQRNRQSQTRINSNDQIIIGETVYDHLGRPAVNILPVPSEETKLKYKEGFNLVGVGDSYSWKDFDVDARAEDPYPLDASSGAAKYYGANGSSEGIDRFIPQSHGFPFTQTVYTDDNTGRVRSQGGLGPVHRIGSGHETKFYYTKPNQKELDRLFGFEVGHASHYWKNIVVDPNGQTSFSYVDMNGNTIATGLSGSVPTGMEELVHYNDPGSLGSGTDPFTGEDIDVELIDEVSNQVSADNRSLVMTHTFVVPSNTDHTFQYTLGDVNFSPTIETCTTSTSCFDVVYDLEIELKDESGTVFNDQVNTPFDISVQRPVDWDTPDQDQCDEDGSYDSGAMLQALTTGQYTVSKTLTINEEALNEYVDDFIAQGQVDGCISEFADFEQDIPCVTYAIGECDDCQDDVDDYYIALCEEAGGSNCTTAVATWITGEGLQTQYEEDLAECDFLCPYNDPLSLCELTYTQLLADVSPGGQYAKYEMNADGTGYTASSFPLSLFNSENLLPPDAQDEPKEWWSFGDYHDQDGNVVTFASTELTAFIDGWQSGHAEVLVEEFHPEYCVYEGWCLDNTYPISPDDDATNMTSDEYDYAMTLAEWDDATSTLVWPVTPFELNTLASTAYVAKSYLDPLDLEGDGYPLDPYFDGRSTDAGESLKLYMEDKLEEFSTWSGSTMASMWETAAISVYCGGYNTDVLGDVRTNCLQPHYTTLPDASSQSDYIDSEEVWAAFRGMYIGAKQRFQEMDLNNYARYNGCYSGCIGVGEEGYDFQEHQMWYTHVNDFSNSPVFDIQQPCFAGTAHLYATKTRRFGGAMPFGTEGTDFVGDDALTYHPHTMEVGNRIPDMPSQTEQNEEAEEITEEMLNEAGYQIYQQTGACPLAMQLQSWLHSLAASANLDASSSSAVPLETVAGFSEGLQDDYLGTNTDVIDYKYQSSTSGTVLTGELYDENTTTTSDAFKLTEPNVSGWTWAAAEGFVEIEDVEWTGTESTFNITVLYNDDANPNTQLAQIEISGETSLDLTCTESDFRQVCPPSEYATTLVNLMNFVIHDHGHLQSTTALDLNSISDIEDFLVPVSGFTGSTSLEWITSTPSTGSPIPDARITIDTDFGISPAADIIIDLFNASGGINLANVSNVSFGAADETAGTCTLEVIVGGNEEEWEAVVTYSYSTGPDTDFPLGECAYPVSEVCSTPRHIYREHLNDFLMDWVNTTTGQSGLDLSSTSYPLDQSVNPNLTSYLRSFLGGGGASDYELDIHEDHDSYTTTELEGMDTRYFTLTHEDGEPNTDYDCDISITLGVASSGYTALFEDITEITDIEAYGDVWSDGYQHEFHAYATVDDGVNDPYEVEIYGESCYPIKNCNSCVTGENQILCDFDDVLNTQDSYNLSCFYQSGFKVEDGQELADCTFGFNTVSFVNTASEFVDSNGDPCADLVGSNHGNSSGQFMLVYLSSTTNKLYETIVEGLDSDTDYEFHAWYMDPTITDDFPTSNPPHLELEMEIRVNGVLNGTSVTVQVEEAAGVWKSISRTWPSPSNLQSTDEVTLTIRQSYNGTAENGAYLFALDDITFRKPCIGTPNEWPDPIPVEWEDPCDQTPTWESEMESYTQTMLYDQYIAELTQQFRADYIEYALENADESLTMDYEITEGHYTLYYYDQAGNLVKTVPPKGVDVIGNTETDANSDNILDKIAEHRAAETDYEEPFPDHSHETVYLYNSLNQLVRMSTPDTRDPGTGNDDDPFRDGDNDDLPDNSTWYWYDHLGRLRLSQNAQQTEDDEYAYTRYDHLGRVVEFGLATGFDDDLREKSYPSLYTSFANLGFPGNMGTITKKEVTFIIYDEVYPFISAPFSQENLRNRISAVLYSEYYPIHDHGIFYSYDVHGNVKKMGQYIKELRDVQNWFTVEYDYDLISGNMKEVHAPHSHHRYEYDADNRLTNVWTSRDGIIWDQDAKYFYYDHGPLARVELGHDKVQGIDYAYTLQGMLKAVNGNILDPEYEMGEDGSTASSNHIHANVARDAFGYTLGYYHQTDPGGLGTTTYDDYTPSNTADDNNIFASLGSSALQSNAANLFNGNISHMATSLAAFNDNPIVGAAYKYDQLNRLVEAVQFDELSYNSGNQKYSWSTTGHSPNDQSDYYSSYKYDSNGNIREIERIAYGTTNAMDDLFFHLKEHNNQLTRAVDAVLGTPFSTDIGDGQGSDNYEYDMNGSLIKDASEQIDEIEWTASGKVKSITRTSSSPKDDLEFFYDGLGNRYLKVSKTKNQTTMVMNDIDAWIFTYYVRDAQGNVLEMYDLNFNDVGGNAYEEILQLTERNWYGSSRLGSDAGLAVKIAEADFDVSSGNYPFDGDLIDKQNITTTLEPIETKSFTLDRGKKQFELTNHLGNVLATVSDKRIYVDGEYSWTSGASGSGNYRFSGYDFVLDAGNGNYDQDVAPDDVNYNFYRPNITLSNRYYPFGMVQPHPDNIAGNYRFGYNGMEKDDEVHNVSGSSYTTPFRQLDPRLGGRWWSRDPIVKPWESPYAGFANNPIYFSDPSGLDPTDPPECPQEGDTWCKENEDGSEWEYTYSEEHGWVGEGGSAPMLPEATIVDENPNPTPPAEESAGATPNDRMKSAARSAADAFIERVSRWDRALQGSGDYRRGGGQTLVSEFAEGSNNAAIKSGSGEMVEVEYFEALARANKSGPGQREVGRGVLKNAKDALKKTTDVIKKTVPKAVTARDVKNTVDDARQETINSDRRVEPTWESNIVLFVDDVTIMEAVYPDGSVKYFMDSRDGEGYQPVPDNYKEYVRSQFGRKPVD